MLHKCENPECGKIFQGEGNRKARFCSRACFKKMVPKDPNFCYTRALGTMNRVAFHPERLTDLTNIVELDSVGELAMMQATKELFSSTEFTDFRARCQTSGSDEHILTDEQQANLLRMLDIETEACLQTGIVPSVLTTDGDLPKGHALLIFNKPVRVLELSKGERIKLASQLLDGITEVSPPDC